MRYKTLRTIHLYLGLSLAPLLIFFAVSGAWQSLTLHKSKKDGSYTAPAVLAQLSEVHIRQRLLPKPDVPDQAAKRRSSVPFQWLALVSGIAVTLLAAVGIWMVFLTSKRVWVPFALLGLGTALPVILIWAGGGL